MGFAESVFRQQLGALAPEHTTQLAEIWDTAVDLIIEKMLDIAVSSIEPVHINLREEQALELGRLLLWITPIFVKDRLARRSVDELTPESEREECLGEHGLRRIEATARELFDHLWLKRYEERWKPKTERLLREESNPPPKKRLKPHPGRRNHFIAKSFIRRGWASGNMILRFRRDARGGFSRERIPFGAWGHVDDLYSPHRETYFGLIEGDAMPCIERLLEVKPLNRPQKEALVGFIVIQRLRNPHFIKLHNEGMKSVVAREVGGDKENDPSYMRRVYDAIYANDDLYHQIASPFFRNRWAMVRAQTDQFPLPDTSAVTVRLDERSYTVVPLTSRDCLVLLPETEDVERIVPHSIQAEEGLLAALRSLLISNAKQEFIAHVSFSLPDPPGVPAAAIARELSGLSAHCAARALREQGEAIERRARRERILGLLRQEEPARMQDSEPEVPDGRDPPSEF